MPKRIEPPFDVKSFLEHGVQFHHAMSALCRHDDQRFALVATPFVVSAAFALEVYFKVLTHIERALLPLKTHHLLHLFNDISEESQQRLEQQWTAEHLPRLQRQLALPGVPAGMPRVESFRQALDLGADAFVDWRYAPRSKNRQFHLPDVVPMARRIIVEKRPDLITVPRVSSFKPTT